MAYVYISDDLKESNWSITTVKQSVFAGKFYRNSGDNPRASEYLSDILSYGTNIATLMMNTVAGTAQWFNSNDAFKIRFIRADSGNDLSVTIYNGNDVIYGPSNMGINLSAWNFMGLVIGVDRASEEACLYYMGNTGGDVTDSNTSFRGYFGYFPISANIIPQTTRKVLYELITSLEPVKDPYIVGGIAAASGVVAGGNFDNTSDTISVPTIPALNLSLNHFLSVYAPTITELNNLADFIWGDYSGGGGHLNKMFADPTDAIISLHMLPFTPSTSTAIEVMVGRYGSGINMSPVTLQFVDVDCGTLTISEYWGNYLDYNPTTRITLFLPFVGEVTLDPDEVMGETLGVKYRVDVVTGSFVCFLSTATKILAQYQGNCALTVPVSSADYSRLNQAVLQTATAAVSFAGGVAAGGATLIGEAEATLEAQGAGQLAQTAINGSQSKVQHSHSGGLGGAAGFMGSQKPYVIIHRPRQSVPANANEFYGYPANITAKLSDLSGFTQVSSIKLDGIPFSEGEVTELRGILKGGFYA